MPWATSVEATSTSSLVHKIPLSTLKVDNWQANNSLPLAQMLWLNSLLQLNTVMCLTTPQMPATTLAARTWITAATIWLLLVWTICLEETSPSLLVQLQSPRISFLSARASTAQTQWALSGLEDMSTSQLLVNLEVQLLANSTFISMDANNLLRSSVLNTSTQSELMMLLKPITLSFCILKSKLTLSSLSIPMVAGIGGVTVTGVLLWLLSATTRSTQLVQIIWPKMVYKSKLSGLWFKISFLNLPLQLLLLEQYS